MSFTVKIELEVDSPTALREALEWIAPHAERNWSEYTGEWPHSSKLYLEDDAAHRNPVGSLTIAPEGALTK